MIPVSQRGTPVVARKPLLCKGFSRERVTGIEPAWPAWKASGTRSRLSVKMVADLRISVFDLDRCGPYWTPFYRPYGPATAPLHTFAGLRGLRSDSAITAAWEPVGLYGQGVILDRITIEPDKMAGQPCIGGLRVPVATVVAMVADGMTTAEIFADLPELEVEDVAQALRYAAAAVRKRELPLRHPGEVLGRREPFATIGGQPDRGRARRRACDRSGNEPS